MHAEPIAAPDLRLLPMRGVDLAHEVAALVG
jgi:hypothetical protein